MSLELKNIIDDESRSLHPKKNNDANLSLIFFQKANSNSPTHGMAHTKTISRLHVTN